MDFDAELESIRGPKLRDIILEVWARKWTVLAVSLTFALLGVAYVTLVPQQKEATLTVYPMTEAEFLKYQPVNDLNKKPRIPITSLMVGQSGQQQQQQLAPAATNPAQDVFVKYDQDYFLKVLFEDLLDRNTLKDAIMANWVGGFPKDSAAAQDELQREIYSYKILRPTTQAEALNARTKVIRPYWTIEYDGLQRAPVRAVLYQALKVSTLNAAEVLKAHFNQKVAVATRDKKSATQDIQNLIDSAYESYDLKTRAYVAFLKEQAQVARAVGIAKATIDVQTLGTNNSIVTNLQGSGDDNSNFYLRGYEAIEKDVEVLQKRKPEEASVPEVLPMIVALRQTEKDLTVETATEAFNNTPIKTGKFVAASYNVNDVDVLNKRSKGFTVILFLLGGVFVSLLFLLLDAILRTDPKETVKR